MQTKKPNYVLITMNLLNNLIIVLTIFILILSFNQSIYAQCKAMIKIDGNATVVNSNDDFSLTLPFWLKENQTLAIGSSVTSISVIEFLITSNNTLEFSGVLNIISTTGETVPQGKVWKIESVAKVNNASSYKNITFSPGTYTWTVPDCAEKICIEMWGGGGGGGGGAWSAGGGGGGGGGGSYGSECFNVSVGAQFNITVGTGGMSGNYDENGTDGTATTISGTGGISLTANGGKAGLKGTSSGGAGGLGGTCNAVNNVNGAKGNNGCTFLSPLCGAGGAGANGGVGGIGQVSNINGNPGLNPGGGGGGGPFYNNGKRGGDGAEGKVIISW